MDYRANIVIAQSPPSLCPIVCGIYCRIFNKKLIVDAHHSAFVKPWLNVPFYFVALRFAVTVIVHNNETEKNLKKKYTGIKFFTLYDKIPEFPVSEKTQEDYFFVVLSYSSDEPLEEMFESFKSYLSKEKRKIPFRITGNYRKKKDMYYKYYDLTGIEFLGFVDNSEYEYLLTNAFGVIALSISQDVQQCASIEAIGASVPIIVTDTDTNRRLFFKGAIFTEPDRICIETAIHEFILKKEKLLEGIKEVKSFWIERWGKDFQNLIERIEE